MAPVEVGDGFFRVLYVLAEKTGFGFEISLGFFNSVKGW